MLDQDLEVQNQVETYSMLGKQITELEKKRDGLKAQLLQRIGTAEKVISDTFTITAGMTAGGMVSFERKPFRNFRITMKGKKNDN